jgi:2-haloalkanoic acid dehalogenase type II
MTLRPIGAVVFDLDGTLCDYTIPVREALAQALHQAGQPSDLLGDLAVAATRYNDLWEELYFEGRGTQSLREAIWIRMLAEHGVDDAALAHTLTGHYIDVRWPSLALLPGVAELLRDLRPHYSLGLLTNGPSDMQRPKIDLLGLDPLFEAIVISGEIGRHKPDPAAFGLILDRLGQTAARALYVGNSLPTDIAGAKAAGMQAAWINRHGQSAVETAPDLILARTADLREVLL